MVKEEGGIAPRKPLEGGSASLEKQIRIRGKCGDGFEIGKWFFHSGTGISHMSKEFFSFLLALLPCTPSCFLMTILVSLISVSPLLLLSL